MARFFVIHAFADPPLRRGNPAAVVLDDPACGDDGRQGLARDFGYSETAFVQPLDGGRFGLRWFTPSVEVDLCGHATLATMAALARWGLVPAGAWTAFDTLSGELRCRLDDGVVSLDFPSIAVALQPAPAGLMAALGLPEDCPHYRDHEDSLVLAPDAARVQALRPDLKALAAYPGRGVCVTAPAAPGQAADFVSRFFGPRVGIDEDPVTGSAHCRLGPFWGARLGKDQLVGWQLSAQGGRVEVVLAGSGRVFLKGRAVIDREGEC